MKWFVMAVVVFAAAPAVAQPQKLTGDQIAGEIWKNRALFQRQQSELDQLRNEVNQLKSVVESSKKPTTPVVVDAAKKKAEEVAERKAKAREREVLLKALLKRITEAQQIKRITEAQQKDPEVQKRQQALLNEIKRLDTELMKRGVEIAGLTETLDAVNLGVDQAQNMLRSMNGGVQQALDNIQVYQNRLDTISFQAASLVKRVNRLEQEVRNIQRPVRLLFALSYWGVRDLKRDDVNLGSSQARFMFGAELPLGREEPCAITTGLSLGAGNHSSKAVGTRFLVECGSQVFKISFGADASVTYGEDNYLTIAALVGPSVTVAGTLRFYVLGGGGGITSIQGVSLLTPMVQVGTAVRF